METAPSSRKPEIPTRLPPCPWCGAIAYSYGTSLLGFYLESASPAAALLTGNPGTAVAKVVSSGGAGMGLFSIPFAFANAMRDLGGHPVLRCGHCARYVCMCSECGIFAVLQDRPKVAELVECPACKAARQPCERSDEFDRLLGIQKR